MRGNKAHPEARQTYQQRRLARIAQSPINDLTPCTVARTKLRRLTVAITAGKRSRGSYAILRCPCSREEPIRSTVVVVACCSGNARKQHRPPPIPVQPLLLTIAPSKPVQRRTPKEQAL